MVLLQGIYGHCLFAHVVDTSHVVEMCIAYFVLKMLAGADRWRHLQCTIIEET